MGNIKVPFSKYKPNISELIIDSCSLYLLFLFNKYQSTESLKIHSFRNLS